MDALAEKLDARLRKWKPETAAEARERITEVIERGRAKMPGFGNTLTDSQIGALLAYLKTL